MGLHPFGADRRAVSRVQGARAIYKVGFRREAPGALKRGKCPGEAQSPLSSVYATVPRGSVARQPLRRRMLSQFLCRAVARWNEPLPIAAGDARRGRSWGCVGAVPASSGSIGEVGSGMARKKRGYRATGPEGRGCGVHIPAVCLRCIFGVFVVFLRRACGNTGRGPVRCQRRSS